MTNEATPMQILLIDDDSFICRILSHQLESLGVRQLTCFERAQDALVYLEQHAASVNLIFCDLQMPEMDGIEFIRHAVRLNYSGAFVPLSGEDKRILQSAERLARSHHLQVPGALVKPVSHERLQQILERVRPRAPSQSTVAARRYTAAELADAIASGELINHYQPKVDLSSAKVVGVEALVRWQHPLDGMVYPDSFIPLVEEAGLIDSLTLCVLGRALRDTRKWLSEDIVRQVAVNISMDNLKNLELPDLIAHEVQSFGLPQSSLVLEVTESRLMNNRQSALEILSRLRLKGIWLSIDDFGTGHSSLVQLRDLPCNELKIDRSFVHSAYSNPDLASILNASLDMARKMGMRTVAEGIESHADWDFLSKAGCDIAQGWFIARAMPAEQLPSWTDDWERRRTKLIRRRPDLPS